MPKASAVDKHSQCKERLAIYILIHATRISNARTVLYVLYLSYFKTLLSSTG